jgi:hypothetical protein
MVEIKSSKLNFQSQPLYRKKKVSEGQKDKRLRK